MNRPLKLSLAVALALGSSAAHGLGLGPIDVRSGLNEPLVAEIPVVLAEGDDPETLKVALASAEDFARVGLDMSALTVPLEFALAQGDGGRPTILVTSEIPVREPFVSFLVEVNWASGKLLREYSLLLDPPVAPAVIGTRTVVEPIAEPESAAPEALPGAEAPAPAPADAAPPPAIAEPAAAEPAPTAAASEPASAPAPESAPAPAAAPSAVPGEYGPVASGETLWEIAESTRPGSAVSVNQMMLAILRANPDAFFQNNVNALKRGAILRIPGAEEVQSYGNAEAAAEIAAQNQQWTGSAPTPALADTGEVATPAIESPSRPAASDSRLELVPPREGASASSSGDRGGAADGTDGAAALRADLVRTQEQLASREQEAQELRTRVQELESLQGDRDRLITLKDSEIADLQRRLREAEAAVEQMRQQSASTAAVPAEATPAEALAEAPAEAPTDAPSEAPGEATAVAGAETPTEPGAEATGPVATPAEPAVAETPAETGGAEVTPLPDAAPVDTAPAPAATAAPAAEPAAPSTPWYRQPLVLGGAGGVALLALLGLLMRGRRKTEAPVADTEGRPSMADNFSGGVFGGGAAAASGATSSEADEERELLQRLAADPTNADAHLDLLRLYYANGDAEKYEAAAGALYAQIVSADAPAWKQAVEMGRELCPGNPLFEAPAPRDDMGEPPAFDFDSLEPKAATAAKPAATGREPDFDFNLVDEPAAPAPAPAAPPAASFATQQMPAIEIPTIAKPELDLGAPEPVAEVSSQEFFGGDDAVGTKLDLARAYLDMGDGEGARSMLQEVLVEGNDAQKSEARRLLAEIG